MQIKEIKTYDLSELPIKTQEKIIDNYRYYNMNETFYAEDDGILYNDKITGYEIFNGNIPKYWSVGYGYHYIQFVLTIKDDEKFNKSFGLNSKLSDKIIIDFENKKETNTKIIFYDIDNNEIDLTESYDKDEFKHLEKKYRLTSYDFKTLQKIELKFDKLIDQSLINLNNNFEWDQSDDNIREIINLNEYRFNEYGDMV